MKSAGGTELQIKYLNKFVDLSKYKNINLIINHAVFAKIVPDKINILWCHHYIDQPSIQMLKNKVFVDKLDAIIFVSDWQYSQFLINYNLPKEKCFVWQSAADSRIPYSKLLRSSCFRGHFVRLSEILICVFCVTEKD